jgi:colanic acid biosynthesis protein WcaH
MLSSEEFRDVVEKTLLCAIDLVVRNPRGEVLLGLRKNRPAQGYWFVPGGRIHKGERVGEALPRVSEEEIGLALRTSDVHLLGVFDHIYDDNAFDVPGFGTQYVIIACAAEIEADVAWPMRQHDEYRFATVEELLADPLVHEYTKSYFRDDPSNLFLR